MENKPFLLFTARSNSTRVPHKMTRVLGNGDTLIDIYLRRMNALLDSGSFSGGGFGVCKNDGNIYTRAVASGVPILERSRASIVKGAPLKTIFDVLNWVKQDYILWVNGCQPFLKNSTIIEVADTISQYPSSMTAVTRSRDILWDEGVPVDQESAKEHRSDSAITRFKSTHSFHVFSRRYLLAFSQYWTGLLNDPFLYEMEDKKEFLDVDTELDFEIVSRLYGGQDA